MTSTRPPASAGQHNDTLLRLVDTAGLLVTVGSGGVGKTTTAAALGLLGALRGRNTLVLTIDPARRLLQALGLQDRALEPNVAIEVLPRMAATLPTPAGPYQRSGLGRLDAMMLDPEVGAEQMVERLLPDPGLREEVMGNRIYRALLPALGASPDLVALELLSELHRRKCWDLIVLDTPPTHNTADFLAAGQTFANFINEGVLKWFAKVPSPDAQERKPGLFSRGGSAAMGLLGRLFGTEVLPDIAQFFRSFRDVMPAMRARSLATDALLRSEITRFVAVTAPGETSLRESEHMLALLRREGLPFAGFVVNRVLRTPEVLADPSARSAIAERLRRRLVDSGMDAAAASSMAQRLKEGAAALHHLDRADASHVARLAALAGRSVWMTVVPQLEHDIHTLAELRDLGTLLVDGTVSAMDTSGHARP